MNPQLTCSQRQWLHSSVGLASQVMGSNSVEILNFSSGFFTQLHKLRSLRRSFLHFHSNTVYPVFPYISCVPMLTLVILYTLYTLVYPVYPSHTVYPVYPYVSFLPTFTLVILYTLYTLVYPVYPCLP